MLPAVHIVWSAILMPVHAPNAKIFMLLSILIMMHLQATATVKFYVLPIAFSVIITQAQSHAPNAQMVMF